MPTGPVLCITGDHLDSKLAAAAIRGAGYEPLVTADSNEGLAVYFVNRKLEAVVLDYRNKESSGICLVEALRSLRADVPIILVASKRFDRVRKGIDVCVCSSDGEDFVSILRAHLKVIVCPNAANLSA